MKRVLLVLVIYSLSLSNVFAQFVQSGQTLEYNGSNPKTCYTGAVDVHFNGASSTYGTNGTFKLHFNQLSQGNVVGPYEIKVGNTDYVIFNQSSLKRWILTPDIDMEVLLCRKSRIDEVIQLYTKNHVKKLDDTISALQDTIAVLKRKSSNADLEIMQLKQLREQYANELTRIKARAVEFAYIDETKLDSLESLKYHYMLSGDIDKAVKVGQQIGYKDVSDNLLSKSRKALQLTHESLEDLFNLIEFVQQHLKNLRILDETYDIHPYQIYRVYPFRDSNTKISDVIDILLHIYEYLIDVYSNHLRCDDLFLKELKDAYADNLYLYTRYADHKNFDVDSYLQAAVDNNNQYALYDIGSYQKCIEVATDSLLIEDAWEMYETREDFLSITHNKDSIYCHIIDGTSDVVVSRVCKNRENTILEIPSYVSYKGRKYKIVKIGRFAYNEGKGKEIEEIIIQEGVERIATNAFAPDWYGDPPIYRSEIKLSLPSSLRVIRDRAFNGYYIENIIIPEGVVHIGKMAFGNWLNVNQPYSISLPSTLTTISEDAIYFMDSGSLAKLSISPKNPYYKMIDGALYTVDSTSIVSSLIPSTCKRLYIPKYHNIDSNSSSFDYLIDRWERWQTGLSELREFVVDKNNPYHFSNNGIIYDRQTNKIRCIPNKAHDVYILNKQERINEIMCNPDNVPFTIWLPRRLSDIERCKMYYSIFDTWDEINRNVSFGFYDENIVGDNSSLMSITDIKVEVIKLLSNQGLLVEDNGWIESLYYNPIDLGHHYLQTESFDDLGEAILNCFAEDGYTDNDLCNYYVKKNRLDDAVLRLPIENAQREEMIISIARNLFNGSNGFSRDSLMMMTWLKKTAEELHSPTSAFNVAWFTEKADNELAIKWYKQAIDYGAGMGTNFRIAYLYYIDKNYENAFGYFMKESEAGDGNASNYVGFMYANGLGVKQNQKMASEYYHKAIALGDEKYAPSNLASYFSITNQLDSAIYYHNTAAKHGNANSWNHLAYIYAEGKGVKPDLTHAMECIDNALKISKEASYYDTKGELAILKGDLSLAREMWNNAVNVDSTFVYATNSTLKVLMPYIDTPEILYTKLYELGDRLYAPVYLGDLAFDRYSSTCLLEQENIKELKNELFKADSLYLLAGNNGNEDAFFRLAQVKYINGKNPEYETWLRKSISERRKFHFLNITQEDIYVSFAYDFLKYLYENGSYDLVISLGNYYLKQSEQLTDRYISILKWVSLEYVGHAYMSTNKDKNKALEVFLEAYKYRSELEKCVKVSSDSLMNDGLEYIIAECYRDNYQYGKCVEWYNRAANSGNERARAILMEDDFISCHSLPSVSIITPDCSSVSYFLFGIEDWNYNSKELLPKLDEIPDGEVNVLTAYYDGEFALRKLNKSDICYWGYRYVNTFSRESLLHSLSLYQSNMQEDGFYDRNKEIIDASNCVVSVNVNGIVFNMIPVTGGTFEMGVPDRTLESEYPPHSVSLSSYYIGETEVTRELWETIMDIKPSLYGRRDVPITNVSWNDCQLFIERLNTATGLSFRLPTEAEWEFAAKGGNVSDGHIYSGSDDIRSVAWSYIDKKSMANPVKSKSPNELGIYDMSGNVFEWCADYYGSYSSLSQTNPHGPDVGEKRVFRGGYWGSGSNLSRVFMRFCIERDDCADYIGFRLVMSEH